MRFALRRMDRFSRVASPAAVIFVVVFSSLGLVLTSPSHASPIRFVLEGTAEIQLDAQSFTDGFKIDALGDTHDIHVFLADTARLVSVPVSATIAGPFGTASFLQPVKITSVQGQIPGFGDGITFSASNGDLFSGGFDPGIVGFNLDRSLGPVVLGTGGPVTSRLAQLDIGQLRLTGVRNLSFTAIPVPEPSTALLFFAGLIGLRLTRHRPASVDRLD